MKSFIEKQELARTLDASQKWEAPTPEDGQQDEIGGVIILPPIMGDTSAEIDQYPADYVEYCLQREREYKRINGEYPKYEHHGLTPPTESEDTEE